MRGADSCQCVESTRDDLARRRPDVLQPEGDLTRDARRHDLVLRILEQRRHRARKRRWTSRPGIPPVDLDPSFESAAVKVRHEPGECPQQRRLARTRSAEDEDDLARVDLQRHVAKGALRSGIRKRQPLDSG